MSTPLAPCGGGNAPSITAQPASQILFAGDTAIFTVAATGTAPLSYQWYKTDFSNPQSNGGQFGGATTNAFGITNITVGNAGDYFVVITNTAGAATSSPLATLTVTNPVPILLSQPASRTVIKGSTVTLSVSAFAAPPITYQWQMFGTNLSNGGNISGATTNVLTITGVGDANAGDYTVAVSNGAGSTTSAPPATLTVVSSGTLAGWNFNGELNTSNPASSHGSGGTASLVGGVTGFSNNIASALPGGLDNTTTFPNNGWGTSTYPTNGNAANNKTAGVQFKANSAGVRNISVSFDLRESATGSRYSRLQYTTNGTDYIDYPVSTDINPNNLANNTGYNSKSFSLVGFPGVANNANFGIRAVSEFESTAKYGFTNNATYVANTSTYGTAGTVSYDIVNITGESITTGISPVVSAGVSLTVYDTSGSSNLTFTISDADTAVGNLTISATSGNTAVLANPSTVNNNNGTATVTINPVANQIGIAPIIVTVTDPEGNAAATWFYVTVIPSNFAPTITSLPHTNTLYNTPLTMAFTVGDDITAVGSLTVSGVSGNQTVISDSNITFGGSGANRTVTLTPNANQIGVAKITVSVNDNDSQNPKSASTTFTLMVRPSTNVVLNDFFDYPDGPIITQSGGLWGNHSGTIGQFQVLGGKAIINGDANSEDVNAFLIGYPYTSNSTTVLYVSYYLTCTSLPSQGGAYITHFRDLNTGASTGFGGRVWVSTTNAAPGTFRVGAGNGESSTNTTAQFPMDLQLNTPYLIVHKFTPMGGTNSTLWVNPFNEDSAKVVATNLTTAPAQPNAIDVVGYCLRESAGGGVMAIDNLVVGKSFADVVPVLSEKNPGGQSVVSWANPLWRLLAAPVVTGPYTNVPAATSPYTNSAGSATFYRLTNTFNLGPL